MRQFVVKLGRVITQNSIIFIHAENEEEARKEFEKTIKEEHNRTGWKTVAHDGETQADEYFVEYGPEEA